MRRIGGWLVSVVVMVATTMSAFAASPIFPIVKPIPHVAPLPPSPPTASPPSPAIVVPAPVAADTSPVPLLPSPVAVQPIINSEWHRALFNRVVADFFPLRWVSDTESPHEIDVSLGELAIPTAARVWFGLPGDGWQETPALTAAIKIANDELESRRRAALQSALAAVRTVTLPVPRAQFSDGAWAALRELHELVSDVQAVFALQIDPQSMELMSEVYRRADPMELQVARRSGLPFCRASHEDSFCSLLPNFPRAQPFALQWPANMSDELLQQWQQKDGASENNPLLSPWTVTTVGSDGAPAWTPFVDVPAAAQHLQRISEALERAAAVAGIDDGAKKQWLAQAAAWRLHQPFPFVASDAAWGQARGELECVLGLYDASNDPWRTKGAMTLLVGRVREVRPAWIAASEQQQQTWEDGVATLLAGSGYAKRVLAKISPTRLIDASIVAGDWQSHMPSDGAVTLPLVENLVRDGAGKRLVLANILEQNFPAVQAIAQRVLVANAQTLVRRDAALQGAVWRQMARNIGPLANTGAAALSGEQRALLQSLHADLVMLWGLKLLIDKQVITADAARAVATTHVAWLLQNLRRDASDPDATRAAIELAYLAQKGALVVQGAQLDVKSDGWSVLLEPLLKEVGRVLITNDRLAAQTLLTAYPAQLAPELLANLQRIAVTDIPLLVLPRYESLE